VEPVAAQRATEDVRRQHRLPTGDDRRAGVDAQGGTAGVQPLGFRVLVDPHSGLLAGAGEFKRQLGGMHNRRCVGVEEAGEVGRRVHFIADPLQTEQPSLAIGGSLLQPGDLVRFGGDRQHARTLPFRVEAQLLDVGLHAVEVLQSYRIERVDFVGPA
jgi:hypothetical protein